MTCGFETTLLILAHMFKIPILVIQQDFIWMSSRVTAIMCPVVLVQDETGFFYVSSIPVVTVPYSIMNEGLFVTSTPSRTSNRPTNTVFSCGLSPINSDTRVNDTNNNVGNKKRKKASNNKSKTVTKNERKSQSVWTAVRNQEMYKESGTETLTTSHETKVLREKIKKFEENTSENTASNVQSTKDSELSTTIDPNEEKKSEDLSTTIDPNAMTIEEDGQKTDIGSEDFCLSPDMTLGMSESTNVDKSCTEVNSMMIDGNKSEFSNKRKVQMTEM